MQVDLPEHPFPADCDHAKGVIAVGVVVFVEVIEGCDRDLHVEHEVKAFGCDCCGCDGLAQIGLVTAKGHHGAKGIILLCDDCGARVDHGLGVCFVHFFLFSAMRRLGFWPL